ncbi:RCC1-like G exchanging factor-like protein isoform X3 [Halichondria panicea]|uniref:RCC1-like G exchanging factor-like protein isoform X3 n=1 Tax=Halichondria panicea TaxID=6063 RepID=UPI00312B46D6
MATLLKKINVFSSYKACPWRRCLHLLCYKNAGTEGATLELPNQDVPNVAAGVGGVVVYSGDRESSCVWYASCLLETPPSAWMRLDLPRPRRVESVTVGRCHIAAVLDDHTVYTAGSNSFGQCGHHGNSEKELKLNPISGSLYKQVACGLDHTLLLTVSGEVLACGWSADGQTGVGHYDNVYEPTSLDVSNVLSMHTCADSSFAITKSGEVYAWGNNEYGQLGLVTPQEQVSHPILLDMSDLDSDVVSIAAGGAFTGLLTSRGSVYVAGYSIEDPSLCVKEGTGGTVIKPEALSRFRKLATHEEITSLDAGLNYLVAGLHGNSGVPRELLVWGRSPCDDANYVPNKRVKVDKSVTGLNYGPTEIVATVMDKTTYCGSISTNGKLC